jgi:purine-binding chemotaxis protein CheW
MSKITFCTFRLENYLFGIDILQVQEIIRRMDFTSIPLAPKVIEGLVNLRGQIITAIDMRIRLGLPPRDGSRSPTHVVVRMEDGAVSLLVDVIGDMLELPDAECEPPPDTIPEHARELICGVYKLEKQLLLILDVTKTVNLDLLQFSDAD